MSWSYYWATGAHASQPAYDQYTHDGCAIGCGPVAWAMLFCWADRQAGTGNAYWAPRWGLYRQDGGTGADALAPLTQTSGVENVIEELHDDVGTFCSFGQGATTPWDMPDADRYFVGRTGTDLVAHWNSVGIHENRLRNYVRDSIKHRDTPALVGTGWLSHYPVAYGYAYQERTVRKSFLWHSWYETVYDRAFYINQGWGGSGNEWITASTWFAGEIYP